MHKLIAGALLLFAVEAKAFFQFTWHGDENFFRGGFFITDQEAVYNSVDHSALTSSVFSLNLSMTDAYGNAATNGFGNLYFIGNPYVNPYGQSDSLYLSVEFGTNDWERPFGCTVIGPNGAYPRIVPGIDGVSYFGSITTSPYKPQGTTAFTEYGYWSYQWVRQIPEPSAAAILATGVAAYALRRHRSRSRKI